MTKRRLKLPKLLTSVYFFDKNEKSRPYALSISAVRIITSKDYSPEVKFKAVHELVDYLFLVYTEESDAAKSSDKSVYSPNTLAIHDRSNETFLSLASGINYYSDRWCWWRVWNIYRRLIELENRYAFKRGSIS